MALNVNIPVPSTKIKDIPTIFPQNWEAIDTALTLEHFSLASTEEAGRHNPGIVGFLKAAATSALTAMSPASGAIALDTTLGMGKTFAVTTCAWQTLSYDLPMSRVTVYLGTDQTLTPGATAIVGIDTKTTDQLTEFNTTTNTFCAYSEGYYLIVAQGTIASIGGAIITMAVSVCGASGVETSRLVDVHNVESTDVFTRSLLGIYSLSSSGCLTMQIVNSSLSGATIQGGSDKTFLVVYRLS